MLFSLINQSQDARITTDVLTRWARAITAQLDEFTPPHHLEGTTLAVDAPSADYPVYLLPDSDVAQAAGYHAVDPDGRPYARVFTRGVELDGSAEAISVILSHEVLEMRLDPNAATWVQDDQSQLWALEACDEVEGRAYTDTTTGTWLSDYLLPGFFTPRTAKSVVSRLDRMGILTAPYTVDDENGYAIVETASGEKQITAKRLAHLSHEARFAKLPDHKRAAGSRTLKRLLPRKAA
jgi:hypothetical protein